MKQPVFIIGAGRSGTTLLYKLITLHKEVGYISNYDTRLFRWLPTPVLTRLVRPFPNLKRKVGFIKSGSAYFISRPFFKKLFPMPVEGESIYQDCSIPLFIPPDYRPSSKTTKCLVRKIERITRLSGASIFVSKRTANNRRISILSEIFPDAKFIHLIRDGRSVALSLSKVDWWDDHILWWSNKAPKEHELNGEDRLSICARNWVYEVSEIKKSLVNIDEEKKLEIRYEKLLADPLSVIDSIISFMGLEIEPDFISAVKKVNLNFHSTKWNRNCSAEQVENISRIELQLLRELGYL